MYLLDTNVVSELRKANANGNSRVLQWFAPIPAQTLFLSAISILEIEIGIQRKERHDLRQGQILRTWLENYVLPAFAGRILAIDLAVARRCASLHIPNPRPERDAMIAATALVHDMTVVTRNVPDLEGTGVKMVNPWE